MIGATLLGYFNERRFKYIIVSQDAIMQEQHENSAEVEKELKELKDTLGSQSTDQEKNKKELDDAKEAQTKVANDLAQAQKQLVDKDAELALLKNELSVKTARVQEVEAALQLLSQPEETSKSKSAQGKGKGKGGRMEVKKEPSSNKKEMNFSSQEGKVLAVNTTWNFIVISLGNHDGMSNGTEISIKRNAQVIAKAKVTSVEASTSVADILLDTVVAGTTVEAGDQILVSEKEIGK